MRLKLEPIVAETIYKGGRTAEEDYARRHPEATVTFMMDWKRREIEAFTYMTPDAAHSFMTLQDDWLEKPGNPELLLSDVLRVVPQQVELRRRKPTLAAKPGTSLHGLGVATDYDTGHLGTKPDGRSYTWREFHEHARAYGWAVHPRAFTDPRAAECWHLAHLGPYPTAQAMIAALMEEHAPDVVGREEAVVNAAAAMLGIRSLNMAAKVAAIQRMGGLHDDGVIGNHTRGYLALLDVQYDRGPSTYRPKPDAVPEARRGTVVVSGKNGG